MTELQFLIDLLLNHGLKASTKKHIADRIAQVESNMYKPSVVIPQAIPINRSTLQAPSTQAILDREGIVPNSTPIASIPAPVLPQATNRIVGGEVQTGKGSRGPRKF